MSRANRIIVVGASAGGIDALSFLFDRLPDDFYPPVLTVLHIGKGMYVNLPSLLCPGCGERVLFAEDKMEALPRQIYLAPPDYHLLLERGGRLSLSTDPKVHYSRPSIDVLFESAAFAAGEAVTGVLLTGGNEDGADGLFRIKEAGGRVLVQDPLTAQAPMMPQAGIDRVKPDLVAPLEGILEALLDNV